MASLCFVCFQSTQDGVYGAVCEYAIVCQSDPGVTKPFPACSQTTWGVRETAVRYGLEPLQSGAVFQTTDGGRAELRLRTSGDYQLLRFTSKLTAYDGKEGRVSRTVDGAVIHRVVGDVAIFSFRFVCTDYLTVRGFPLIPGSGRYVG